MKLIKQDGDIIEYHGEDLYVAPIYQHHGSITVTGWGLYLNKKNKLITLGSYADVEIALDEANTIQDIYNEPYFLGMEYESDLEFMEDDYEY